MHGCVLICVCADVFESCSCTKHMKWSHWERWCSVLVCVRLRLCTGLKRRERLTAEANFIGQDAVFLCSQSPL